MNLDFCYTTELDIIRTNYPMIICKFCQMPLVRPVLCTNCHDYMCQLCPSLCASNRCCDTNFIINLNNADNSFNGKGAIVKTLELLEIFCAVNRENGCKWIGRRGEYLDHYHECTNNYKLCVFGCGAFVSNDNVEHLNHCNAYDNWLSLKPLQLNIDDKYLCHLKHNQFENHKFEEKINKLKNNTLISKYHGTIVADDNINSHTLAELVLPNEDTTWMISIYLSWKSSVPGLDDHIKNIQQYQQINNGSIIGPQNEQQIRDKSIYDTCIKYNLPYDEFKSDWVNKLKNYVESKSIEFTLLNCDNNLKQLFHSDWNNDIKKYVERKSIEFVCNKFNLQPLHEYVNNWTKAMCKFIALQTDTEFNKTDYRSNYLFDYMSDKYNIKLIYNPSFPGGIFTPNGNINPYHCVFTKHMPCSTQKHNDFINDIKLFENDVNQRIKIQKTLICNTIRSGIIKQIEDVKKEYHHNLFNEIDSPRKKFHDNLYNEINGVFLNYYNNYLSEINNPRNHCDNISKYIELRINKNIKIGDINYNFESHKKDPLLLSVKKDTNIELRTIKILINSIKTGTIGPMFGEQLIIDNAIIIANKIG